MAITVEVRGGNLEKALRVLKKKVQKAGIVKEIEQNNTFLNHQKLNVKKPKNVLK